MFSLSSQFQLFHQLSGCPWASLISSLGLFSLLEKEGIVPRSLRALSSSNTLCICGKHDPCLRVMGMRSPGDLKETGRCCHVVGTWQVGTHFVERPRPRLWLLWTVDNFLLPPIRGSLPIPPLPLPQPFTCSAEGAAGTCFCSVCKLGKHQDAALFQALGERGL